MPERRRFGRTNISKAAKIFCDRSSASIDCVVCDVSIGGVGIALANASDVSDDFELTFDAARTLRPCRVAWRSQDRLGAMFLT
jgi:c-di-GMP-binding flagellar brake protein YcgR